MTAVPFLLLCLGVANAQIHFEGCFTDLDESKGFSRDFDNTNLNEDCAHFCADNGHVLSVTRGALCHCTSDFPGTVLVDAIDASRTGTQAPCTMRCPGSVQEGDCEGDECCGGTRGGKPAYSVFAVGAINPVRVLKQRVYRALRKFTNKMPWKDEIIEADCKESDYIKFNYPYGNAKLDLERDEYTVKSNCYSLMHCKRYCDVDRLCRSISYFARSKICTLNRVSSLESKSIPTLERAVVYDKNCTYNVDMVPTSFQLDVLRHETMMKQEPANSRVPLHNEDFELDLTNSNAEDSIKRKIVIGAGEDLQMSNEAGFTLGESRQETHNISRTDSTSNTTARETTRDTQQKYGFHVGGSVGGSVGGTFKGLDIGVSASVETGYSSEFSRGFSETESQSRTDQDSVTRGTKTSESESRSSIYNRGYVKSLRTDDTKTYEYSMTVPPLHKGMMNFFMEKKPLIIKWKSVLQVNGYVKIRIDGDVEEVHVSRLLPAQERYLYTMGTIAYDRQVIVGKVSIYNRLGKKIEDESGLVASSTEKEDDK